MPVRIGSLLRDRGGRKRGQSDRRRVVGQDAEIEHEHVYGDQRDDQAHCCAASATTTGAIRLETTM